MRNPLAWLLRKPKNVIEYPVSARINNGFSVWVFAPTMKQATYYAEQFGLTPQDDYVVASTPGHAVGAEIDTVYIVYTDEATVEWTAAMERLAENLIARRTNVVQIGHGTATYSGIAAELDHKM